MTTIRYIKPKQSKLSFLTSCWLKAWEHANKDNLISMDINLSCGECLFILKGSK